MVNLEIPNHRQASKSTTCGPVCVQMILDYLGDRRTLEEICDLCDFDPRGTFETSLALALFRLGIPSTVFMEPDGERIKGSYLGLSQGRVASILKARSTKTQQEAQQRGFQELYEVVKNGLYKFQIATRRRIEEEIDAGNPWIVVVPAYDFYDKADKDSNRRKDLVHFIIIQGYDEDCYIVNDPAADGKGVSRIDKDYLLYCMYKSEGYATCVEVNSVTDIRSDELIFEGGTN